MSNKKIPETILRAENKRYIMMEHQEKFLDSIKSQWEDRGVISKKQEDILDSIIDQCMIFAQRCRIAGSRGGFDD